MTREEIADKIGVKIAKKEYKYLEAFCGKVSDIELMRLLLIYRYKLLQTYENGVRDMHKALQNLQGNLDL